jgi:hypothetical protein
MKFRKVTVLVSLFAGCCVLAAQSAKADDILFNDLGDTVTVTNLLGGPVTSRLSFTCPSGGDSCSATLSPPSIGGLTTSIISYTLGEGSTTGNMSDMLVSVPLLLAAHLTFNSDLPSAEATGLGPCVVAIPIPRTGCNAVESGMPQLAGTITWKTLLGTTTGTDNIYVESGVEPEPASMILFGSGLVIVGGFLRRRRRPVAASAAA